MVRILIRNGRLLNILKIKNSCKGDFQALADKLYATTIFADEAKFTAFVNAFNKGSVAKLQKDPIYSLAKSASRFYFGKCKR